LVHLALTTSTSDNAVIAIGEYCCNDSDGGQNNIAIGNTYCQLNIDGKNNVCVGHGSGYANLHGSWNTLIGNGSGSAYLNNESHNIVMGNSSGMAGDSGFIRIGDGNQRKLKIPNMAYYNNTLGNISFGIDFPNADPALTVCMAIGDFAMNNETTGGGSTICGALAMQYITTGGSNCAFGYSYLRQLLTGSNNIAFGSQTATNYTGAESNNIVISNAGTVNDNQTIRIGTSQTDFYMAQMAQYNVVNGNCTFGSYMPNTMNGPNTGFGQLCCNAIITGANNCATGNQAIQSATTATNNTATGTSALRFLTTGSGNCCYGYYSGSAYTGAESNNLIIGNFLQGTVGESNVTRIGIGQTKCFLAGIHGITPVGATQTVIIDSNGQLGSVATSSSPSFESTTSTIAIDSPAIFGNITVYFSRINKLVNCVISAKTHDFTGSPQNTISTLGGVILASYKPVENVLFPMIFKSNNVYDTGLIGNVIVSSAGAFLFSRDNDAAPEVFDSIAGWGWAISLSWVTA
jgi:hypothetical protein